MDLLYDFSSAKVSSDALSSRYKKSVGRNKLWTAVQRDVKKKQNKMEKEAEKVIEGFLSCEPGNLRISFLKITR